MRQRLLSLVEENYPAIATDLLRPLTQLMSLSRQYCGGDVDKFLIILVVAVRTTEHKAFATYSQAQLLSGEVPVFPGLGTNIRSIATSLSMSRETVRRKVGELAEAGWLARDGHTLFFTATAYQSLAPVRESLELLAVRYYEVVSRLVEAAR